MQANTELVHLTIMKENKVSQRAGYAASAFSIAMLAVGAGYYAVAGNAPIWMPLFMGFCMVSAAGSGVVCLVSASFVHFRAKRDSAGHVDSAAVKSSQQSP